MWVPAGKTFGDVEKKAYVALVRSGGGLSRSAKKLGWTMRTVDVARKADPEFAEDVRMALEEASEPVEDVLYEAALRGEPWAVQMWLKGRLRERWSDKIEVGVEVSGTVEIEAGKRLEGIARLQEVLAQRAAELGPGVVVDAESTVKPST